jgi:hypothetical protein
MASCEIDVRYSDSKNKGVWVIEIEWDLCRIVLIIYRVDRVHIALCHDLYRVKDQQRAEDDDDRQTDKTSSQCTVASLGFYP